jgi:hypothetical protein
LPTMINSEACATQLRCSFSNINASMGYCVPFYDQLRSILNQNALLV